MKPESQRVKLGSKLAAKPIPARISSAPVFPEGAVGFNVSVRVEIDEFAGWQPEQIAAFFAGISKVLAVKANIELETSS